MTTSEKLREFLHKRCVPAESKLAQFKGTGYPAFMQQLKLEAKSLGLFNLFFLLPHNLPLYAKLQLDYPDQLDKVDASTLPKSLQEYGQLCEIMGWSPLIAPEACNCSAPDTGNMELLAQFGSEEQHGRLLVPLLSGRCRSAFAMTEPHVASSDPLNITASLARNSQGQLVLNGKKWYISNAAHPNLAFFLVFCKSPVEYVKSKNPYLGYSVVVVDAKADGVRIGRRMQVLGHDGGLEGHCEVDFKGVVVTSDNVIAGFNRGFEMIQSRLGNGRIHHCMRAIGMAERTFQALVERAAQRKAFGKTLSQFNDVQQIIANARVNIDSCRLMVLKTAKLIDDTKGSKHPETRKYISMIKVMVPKMLCQVVDDTLQVHGAAGLSQDSFLSLFYCLARALKIADGPDAVHLMTIAKMELKGKL